jgi:hypothetical protein
MIDEMQEDEPDDRDEDEGEDEKEDRYAVAAREARNTVQNKAAGIIGDGTPVIETKHAVAPIDNRKKPPGVRKGGRPPKRTVVPPITKKESDAQLAALSEKIETKAPEQATGTDAE